MLKKHGVSDYTRLSAFRFSGIPQKRHFAPFASQEGQMKKYFWQ
jgi:hypothetical protein